MIDFNVRVRVAGSGECGVVKAYLPRTFATGFDYWVVELTSGGLDMFLSSELEVV